MGMLPWWLLGGWGCGRITVLGSQKCGVSRGPHLALPPEMRHLSVSGVAALMRLKGLSAGVWAEEQQCLEPMVRERLSPVCPVPFFYNVFFFFNRNSLILLKFMFV